MEIQRENTQNNRGSEQFTERAEVAEAVSLNTNFTGTESTAITEAVRIADGATEVESKLAPKIEQLLSEWPQALAQDMIRDMLEAAPADSKEVEVALRKIVAAAQVYATDFVAHKSAYTKASEEFSRVVRGVSLEHDRQQAIPEAQKLIAELQEIAKTDDFEKAMQTARDSNMSIPVSDRWYAHERSLFDDVSERVGYNIKGHNFRTEAVYLNNNIEIYQQLEIGPDGFQIGRYNAKHESVGSPHELTPEGVAFALISKAEYFSPAIHDTSAWRRSAFERLGGFVSVGNYRRGGGESLESVLERTSLQLETVKNRNELGFPHRL